MKWPKLYQILDVIFLGCIVVGCVTAIVEGDRKSMIASVPIFTGLIFFNHLFLGDQNL